MKLFISYARVDKPLCKQVVHQLEDVHEVWYDKRLHAGQEWWQEIQVRLAWCEGFVYLLSPESVVSEYCQKEFALAADAGKHLFPVLIQARTEIPTSLSHIHYADLSQGMEDVITLIKALAVAERRQFKRQVIVEPLIMADTPPADISPTLAIAKVADALENENFDNAVFILKQATQKHPDGRIARILGNMLSEAESALEKQTYLREAAREYNPIAQLASRPATQHMACIEFHDFQQAFPDYDPQNIASLCVELSTIRAPKLVTSKALLPASFDWVPIPAGKVTLEDNKGTFDVAAFEIAKYPITVAQYKLFMQDEGYANPDWWTTAGWEAREQGWGIVDGKWEPTGKAWMEPRYWQEKEWQALWKADHPIVGISWYEACAFTNWLSTKTGESIHLPTEQQWQWAAQGDDGRTYPWGKDWDASRCNNDVEGQDWQKKKAAGKITTPVTHYEGQGNSPFGVVDMAGNVWEWTLSAYDSAKEDIDSTNSRVLRGGSWYGTNVVNFRCANRSRFNPYNRHCNLGFCVARAS